MYVPPRYEIYTKNDKKVLIFIYYIAIPIKSIRHIYFIVMFKTYVLTNNIKVNTKMFFSLGFMKLANKNHGASHIPPRRFIFNWPIIMIFLLISHFSFLLILTCTWCCVFFLCTRHAPLILLTIRTYSCRYGRVWPNTRRGSLVICFC